MNNLQELLNSDEGKKLTQNKDGLQKLASGKDGQKVLGMLQENNVEEAIKSGDTAAMKAAIEKAMKTEEGARLFNEISKLIKM